MNTSKIDNMNDFFQIILDFRKAFDTRYGLTLKIKITKEMREKFYDFFGTGEIESVYVPTKIIEERMNNPKVKTEFSHYEVTYMGVRIEVH